MGDDRDNASRSGGSSVGAGGEKAGGDREERLAAALRRNLVKRKAQSRGRIQAADEENGGPTDA